MVLCFIALFVFAFLGIFSAKYRALAGEAFGCVIRTATLRPCQSGLDERIKATLIAKLLEKSPFLARIINSHFQVLSVAFTVLFFASMLYSAVSVYNYWAYGNCNGPESSAFCVFDAVANSGAAQLKPVFPGVGQKLGSGNITLVEFGCFDCQYTKATEPYLQEFLLKHPEVSLEFRILPITGHNGSFDTAKAAFCAEEQGKFWEYHDALFADADHSAESLVKIAEKTGVETGRFAECMQSESAAERVRVDEKAGRDAGIYGTPTFYLNGVSLVGPQSIADFESLLKGNVQHGPGQVSSCTTH